MRIGKFTFNTPVILAPMAGVTDRPFRQLCKRLGADIAVSEMVGANSLLHGSLKTKRRANHEGEVSPKIVQIAGACPKMLAEAAKYNQDSGAEIIDINMGCPAKKICNMASGSALLRDEDLVKRILQEVVAAVDLPVTLKIRTGWDKTSRNALTIGTIAQEAGIQALSVHGRTRNCFFKGEAEFETIAELKAKLQIPIIANGDITTPEKALAVLQKTNADGIMLGRAAQGKPWIFREIKHFLATKEKLPNPSVTEIATIMLQHIQELYKFYGEYTGVRIARKHISWYSKGQKGSAEFRHSFNKIEDAATQFAFAKEFFATL